MTQKRLFVVRLEHELVVLADNAKDAEKEALEADDLEWDAHAQEMRYLPGGYEMDEIPWGHRDPAAPDRTIKEWVDLGAAPKLMKPPTPEQLEQLKRSLPDPPKETPPGVDQES